MVLSKEIGVNFEQLRNGVSVWLKEWREFEVFVRPEILALREGVGSWEVHSDNHVVVIVQSSDSSPKLDHLELVIGSEDANCQFKVDPRGLEISRGGPQGNFTGDAAEYFARAC